MSDLPDNNKQDIQDSKNSANANNGDAHCNNNKNNVNPSFNNTNQLIGINITNLILKSNDKIADLVSNKKIVGSIIISITTIALFIVFGTVVIFKLPWQKSNSSEIMIYSLANDLSSPSPDLLETLDDYLQETNRLPETKIDRAIERYNLIIRVAEKLEDYLENNKNAKNEFDSTEAAKKTVREISSDVKTILKSKIHKHRIPELEEQLEKKKFGEIVNLSPGEFENQYTQGAIQTTYKILMRPYGFHADRNKDGFITNEKEAETIPCKTLQEIERLWRDNTDDRCGWYELEEPDYINLYINSQCKELSRTTVQSILLENKVLENKKIEQKRTLLATIFKTEDFEFIEPKIINCVKNEKTSVSRNNNYFSFLSLDR